jgi:hypothetical protein
MRFIYLLLILLLLPFTGFAQRDFTLGTYELINGTKGDGELKYTSGSGAELIVKSDKKGKTSFSPKEVKNFTVANQNFVPIGGFILDSGLPMTPKSRIDNDFAQLVDSGRVDLLKYTFLTRGMASANSTAQYAGLLLIRKRGQPLTSIPIGPKKARPIITSFLKDSPELIARFNKEPYSEESIRAIIQAYNSEQKK